jgi:NAD(P)-dependent dehydrogenase (short-subunit alcohol dehydrogenase family)
MKKVCITGGANGIGYAICELYLKKGFEVYTIDVKKPDYLDPKIHFDLVDIKDSHAVESYVNSLNQIDILINNAAIQIEEPFIQSSYESMKKVIDTNILGTLSVTHQMIPKLNKDAQIINIGSIHGSIPRKNKMTYDMSKAALEVMTKELALELAPNIRVNQLNIGATLTPMNQIFNENENKLKEAASKVPLQHIFTPEEIAEVIYELTTDTFRFMTGSIITYDGGRSLT